MSAMKKMKQEKGKENQGVTPYQIKPLCWGDIWAEARIK